MPTVNVIQYRRRAAYVLFFVALVAAVRMYFLQADERLWGNWPLLLLLSAWGGIVLLRQHPERLRWLKYSSGVGLLLGISFAPYGSIWAPVLGFVLLLVFVDELAGASVTKRQVFWYAYHAMVLFNVVATWWVANTAIAAGVVANFLNAVFMATVVLLVYQVRRLMPRWWLLGAVGLWIGFEFLHFNWQIAWPWLCVGHTFATAPALAQWFSVTGVFGGSLHVWGSAVLLYRVYANRSATGSEYEVLPVFRSLAKTVVVLVAPLVASLLMYAYAETLEAPTVSVAAVQPNFEPHYRKFRVTEQEQLETFEVLTAEALGELAQLVVYPETSFSGVDEALVQTEPFYGRWLRAAGENPQLRPALITGLSSYRRLAGPTDDPALRTQHLGEQSLYYIAHNSATFVDAEGEPEFYYKSKLVPGVEFLPYRKLLFFFEPLVASLGGTTAGLGRNDAPEVFELRSGVVAAPLICYESIYGDYVRRFVDAGANLLVVPTNDGWWDKSPGYRQHWHFARLRAIETRRWVVQAANSGTSGFIDERGRIVAETNYDEETVLIERVELLSGKTLYVRFGDVIGWVMAGVALFFLGALVVGRVKNRVPT